MQNRDTVAYTLTYTQIHMQRRGRRWRRAQHVHNDALKRSPAYGILITIAIVDPPFSTIFHFPLVPSCLPLTPSPMSSEFSPTLPVLSPDRIKSKSAVALAKAKCAKLMSVTCVLLTLCHAHRAPSCAFAAHPCRCHSTCGGVANVRDAVANYIKVFVFKNKCVFTLSRKENSILILNKQ